MVSAGDRSLASRNRLVVGGSLRSTPVRKACQADRPWPFTGTCQPLRPVLILTPGGREQVHEKNGAVSIQIFDSHIHLFSEAVIANVRSKRQMVRQLKLSANDAHTRTRVPALLRDMQAAHVAGALLLPTASAAGVHRTNRRCIEIAARTDALETAGTLHPQTPALNEGIACLQRHRVRIIKLCSFSQGFDLRAPETRSMFDALQSANRNSRRPMAVLLDTLYAADSHFGTRPEYNTTPRLLADLVDRYPDIGFIAAHMGGLNAPFDEIRTHLSPRANLFLDTSNAAHILTEREFCGLVTAHGPDKILFGTDWPWFLQAREVEKINGLLDIAGFSREEKGRVFYHNAAALIGDA